MESDEAICPDCGSAEFEVLKDSPQNVTLQCADCKKVRSFSPRRARIIEVNTVVSDGEKSWSVKIPTPDTEVIAQGDEFELDGHRMMVTAVEIEGHRRPSKAPASEVLTLFAKVFDTVVLKLSVNERDVTRSYRINVEPEFPVSIGLILEAGGERLIVKTLKSDQNRTVHNGFLFARNVRRAFCDVAPHFAKVGQIKGTRRRGAPIERKGAPPSPRTKGPRGQRTPKRS